MRGFDLASDISSSGSLWRACGPDTRGRRGDTPRFGGAADDGGTGSSAVARPHEANGDARPETTSRDLSLRFQLQLRSQPTTSEVYSKPSRTRSSSWISQVASNFSKLPDRTNVRLSGATNSSVIRLRFWSRSRLRDRHIAQRDGVSCQPTRAPRWARGWQLVGRRKDGLHEVPVEISLSRSWPPMQVLLVVASVRDVTARRKADAQLQKMEQRYRTLVEGIPAVTFMAAMDEGANELYVSPQIEELLGFSQKEWVENPILWFTQLHPWTTGPRVARRVRPDRIDRRAVPIRLLAALSLATAGSFGFTAKLRWSATRLAGRDCLKA